MTNRLMVSVAAIALVAGAGFAHAQGAGGAAGGGAAGGATMNRDSAAPSPGAAPGGAPETRSGQSDQKSGMAPKNQHAEDGMKGPKSTSSETDSKGGAKNMKAEGRDSKGGTGAAENRDGRSDATKNAETKTGGDRSQTTTGQAGAGAKLSTEQRTKISTVIRSQRVEPVTNVNFNISVGTRVPREVHFHPLPAEVVTVYPEWRGYDFILVRDQILVIDPRSHEIVAVLDT
ncbi:DUF1236 domain-containing protein [Bradyrhizobium ontarionense]|uniref:DUF1236 domain-containing protein n=1 Tax=Bradyrhizobium ontarionense TaxID=2898149 RepID=A0ABY3REK6_9BRAD|nr:DUF1236 domain-containing protein [Bradyrhizobium sp. A19]UFZ05427.1 DUF1236 domain-containing protein [Bradyrhizobium sp. A19]